MSLCLQASDLRTHLRRKAFSFSVWTLLYRLFIYQQCETKVKALNMERSNGTKVITIKRLIKEMTTRHEVKDVGKGRGNVFKLLSRNS